VVAQVPRVVVDGDGDGVEQLQAIVAAGDRGDRWDGAPVPETLDQAGAGGDSSAVGAASLDH